MPCGACQAKHIPHSSTALPKIPPGEEFTSGVLSKTSGDNSNNIADTITIIAIVFASIALFLMLLFLALRFYGKRQARSSRSSFFEL